MTEYAAYLVGYIKFAEFNIFPLYVGDDTCSNTLGMENGEIKPEQIIASSSHEPSSVGPNNARLNVDISGGAWCPRALIDSNSKEYIEIDLEKPYLISGVLTQGRFGNGQGQEFAEAFRLQYWRNGMKDFVTYKSRDGQEIMKGNSNTYTVKENILESPVVAQKVRIVPFASHSRTVCMRLELLGCPYESKLTRYNFFFSNKILTRQMSSMVHSARSTVSPVATTILT